MPPALNLAIGHTVDWRISENPIMCPKQQYVGLTRDLRKRLIDHNSGRSPHTSKFCPWLLVAYFAFSTERTAIAFEKYLKSG